MNKSDSFACWLQQARSAVNERLQTLLSQQTICEPLTAAMAHSVLDGGKRLRPAVLFAVAEQNHSNKNNTHPTPQAIDAACAVELIHCYSLVHDDMPCMDNDDTRRGKPACHKAHGEGIALLAGDCLQTLAFETLAASGMPAAAVTVLARAAGAAGMGGGQALDITNTTQNEQQLETMHRLKTGALFNSALQLGLMCRSGSTSPQLIKTTEKFAAAFGLLFQIANDLQDEKQDKQAGRTTYVTHLSRDRATAQAHAAKQRAVAAAAPFPRLIDITRAVYP